MYPYTSKQKNVSWIPLFWKYSEIWRKIMYYITLSNIYVIILIALKWKHIIIYTYKQVIFQIENVSQTNKSCLRKFLFVWGSMMKCLVNNSNSTILNIILHINLVFRFYIMYSLVKIPNFFRLSLVLENMLTKLIGKCSIVSIT